jgi:hypothetical protein
VKSVQDAERMRSPSVRSNDEKVHQVKELFLQYKRITISQVANMLYMPFGSVEQIWRENLKMCHIVNQFVPKPAGWLCLSVNFWLKTKLPMFHTLSTYQTYNKYKIAFKVR